MGVPLLLTWLRRKFANCFFPAEGDLASDIRGNVDNLYIDLNSLLYQSSMIISVSCGRYRTVEEVEEAVLRKLFDLLDDIVLGLVQPRALVYIAVDGISPLGKMSQQRSRRLRQSQRRSGPSGGHHHRRGFDAEREDAEADGRTETMATLWDNNCITVGTRFMAKVTEALHTYAVSRTERVNVRRLQSAMDSGGDGFTPLAIVVDDVLRPGEGENKILELIRRFREQPDYNANLVHAVCSSDTDVTVSSLLLHEPRMFVLRYEPPPALGGKDPAFAASRAGPPGGGPGAGGGADSWSSTFFSIYLFREGLRRLLGLAPLECLAAAGGEGAGEAAAAAQQRPPEIAPEAAASFERALHDVVFVMLLFGNDFLPTLGGSIQEGTLDALLSLLASDFVSRGKTVVDPETNHIHFTSARYLLDCLSDIRGRDAGGVLSVHGAPRGGHGHGRTHGPTPTAPSPAAGGGIGTDWGFTEDPEFQQRRVERERALERKCYCYWTMLQWALQYSAGVVDHWGCYYPFSDAPPLHALRKYCGVLSYEALIKFVASRHAARRAGKDAETQELPTPDATGSAASTTPGANAGEPSASSRRTISRPTDAMVQLLVLTPPSSSVLLPTVLRNAYSEIAPAVQARVEELDIALVERWCEERRRLLNEEERTRFGAYQLFATPDPLPLTRALATAAAAAAAASDAGGRHPPRPLPASEATFMAYWDAEGVTRELAAAARARASTSATAGAAVAAEAERQAAVPPPAPALPARHVASIFESRRGRGTGAAAAALLKAPVAPVVPPPAPSAPLPSPPTPTPTPTPAAPAPATPATPAAVSAGLSPEVEVVTNPDRGVFFHVGQPKAYLPTDSLARAMGYLDGPLFVIGAPGAAAIAACQPLSRDTVTHQVRLQWRIAVPAPPPYTLLGSATAAASSSGVVDVNATPMAPSSIAARTGLLRGYAPPTAPVRSAAEVVAARRAALVAADRPRGDPWREIDLKRPRVEAETTH